MKKHLSYPTRILQMPSVQKQAQQGFTLIELLVVIAIIGILAALFLGGISKAMESGRKTTCLNNLTQIGKGYRNYSEDNNDILPPAGSASVAEPNWANHIAVYMGLRPKDEDYVTNAQIGKSKMMLCPTAFRKQRSGIDSDTPLRSYGRNSHLKPLKRLAASRLDPNRFYPEQTYPTTLFEVPSKTLLAADGQWSSNEWRKFFDNGAASDDETYIHASTSVNGLFVDGHAERILKRHLPVDEVDNDEFFEDQDYSGRMFWQGVYEDPDP